MHSVKRKIKKYSKNRSIKKINRNKNNNKKTRISKNNKKRVSKKKIYKKKQYIKSGGAVFNRLKEVQNELSSLDYKGKNYKEILNDVIKTLQANPFNNNINCEIGNEFKGFSEESECINKELLEKILEAIKKVDHVDVSKIITILENGLSNEKKLEALKKLEGIKEIKEPGSNEKEVERNSGVGTNSNSNNDL